MPQWEKKKQLLSGTCASTIASHGSLCLCAHPSHSQFFNFQLCSAPRVFFPPLKLNQMMLLFHLQTLQWLPIKYKLLTDYKAVGRLASLIFESLLLIHWVPTLIPWHALWPVEVRGTDPLLSPSPDKAEEDSRSSSEAPRWFNPYPHISIPSFSVLFFPIPCRGSLNSSPTIN